MYIYTSKEASGTKDVGMCSGSWNKPVWEEFLCSCAGQTTFINNDSIIIVIQVIPKRSQKKIFGSDCKSTKQHFKINVVAVHRRMRLDVYVHL